MTTSMNVANTIANQIGGTCVLAKLIGARNFMGGENFLSFKHMRAAKSAVYTKITLNGSDTYDIQLGKTVKYTFVVTASAEGVYADQLVETLENMSGLAYRF